MRRVARVLIPLTALALLGGGAAPPDELDQFVMSQMQRRHINGVSLAIVDGGKIVVARAYGVTDRGEARRVDTATLFQAGSISKSVAALGALRLVEQQKLDLDADVNVALKSWHLPASSYTASTPVTLRGLLSHTAGLTVHGFPGYDADSAMPTLVQVLDGTKPTNTPAIRSESKPGDRWNYSGGGYTIMQQLMIDVTGETFPAYMHRAVIGPLGMGRSTYEQPLPAARAATTAAGHYGDGSKVHKRWHVYPEMAAAGLWTTASDLARFAIGIQRAYAGDATGLLSQAMAKQMLSDHKDGDGLGVFVQGKDSTLRFSHGGRDEGFDAQLTATANTGQAVAIMINANDDSRFMSRLVDYVTRTYHWAGASEYRAPAAVSITPAQLEAATGLYELGGGNFATFVARDGHLFTSVGGGLDQEFVPVGVDEFASTERFLRVTIKRAADGSATSLEWATPGGRRTFARLGPLLRVGFASAGDALTSARADSVLHAMGRGGEAMRTVTGVSAGVRADFGTRVWPPVVGLTTLRCAGSARVTGGEVRRHGSAVTHIVYCRAGTAAGNRQFVVYFTADNLVTDVDTVDE